MLLWLINDGLIDNNILFYDCEKRPLLLITL